MLMIGKITGTHGLKGDLKVLPLTDYPERFSQMTEVTVGTEQQKNKYTVERVKKHKDFYLFKFKGLDDIDQAKVLKNNFLFIKKEDAVELPKDTYFLYEIIGLEAYKEDGEYLGEVTEVFHTGSNDVYVIKGQAGREQLVPALKSLITIDVPNKKMIVKEMQGLLNDAEEV